MQILKMLYNEFQLHVHAGIVVTTTAIIFILIWVRIPTTWLADVQMIAIYLWSTSML